MTVLEGNSDFFPENLDVFRNKSYDRATLKFEGNKIYCFLKGLVIQ